MSTIGATISNQESKASSGGGEESSGSGGGSSSGGGQGNKAISNVGKTTLFKEGKKVGVLEEGDIKGYNWLSKEGTDGVININDLQQSPYYGGGCVLNLENKFTISKVITEGVKPIIKSQVNVLVKIEEIKTTPENENQFNQSGKSYITEEVKQKVKEQILQDINTTVEKCKGYNVDIFEVISRFKRLKPKEYKKLLTFYGSEDAFFQACQFETEVIVRSIL